MLDEVWKEESDRLSFVSNGFNCLILRHGSMKHLCGFIGITESNINYRADYPTVDKFVDVHKGLTFSDFGTHGLDRDDINYKRCYDDEGYELWWFGFDCAREGDLTPYDYYISKSLDLPIEGEYRDLLYVRAELVKLSEQLKHSLR